MPDAVELSFERGFMYRPGEVIARGDDSIAFVVRSFEHEGMDMSEVGELPEARFGGIGDPLAVVDTARSRGFDVQPNHVFVSHCGCGCGDPCCDVHPRCADLTALDADPFIANPFIANPFIANPFIANPSRLNAVCGNPFQLNPFIANDAPTSSAQPADVSNPPAGVKASVGNAVRVLVLDTGLADHALLAAWHDPVHDDVPDHDPKDQQLDPVAGHGTFIAGQIARFTDDVDVVVRKIVSPRGVVDEWIVGQELDRARLDKFDVVNMSFGGPASPWIGYLQGKVSAARRSGVLLVASAGNDASCCPNYPAAFPEVVAVGAVDEFGPAEFTNFGSWVNVFAHGVDLVSTFFEFDQFDGWARWSGTSFAAPLVAAKLANLLVAGASPDDAVDHILNDETKPAIPCLGRMVGQILSDFSDDGTMTGSQSSTAPGDCAES